MCLLFAFNKIRFSCDEAHIYVYHVQGSHRLGKHLNLEGFLEKSLKIRYALKSTGKSLEGP